MRPARTFISGLNMEMKNTDQVDGFVYLWFDTLRKMFYIGSHAGSEDDGYIASSTRCKRAVKKRPETFKRKILARITGSRKDLLAEESRWLQMIQVHELGTKYYNLKRVAGGGNLMESKTQEEIDEWRQKVSKGGKRGWEESKPERREKTRRTAFGGNTFDRGYLKTEAFSKTISIACSGEKNGFFGKTHSEQSRAKMSESGKARSPNHVKSFILTRPDGTELQITNLVDFVSNNGGRVKLTRFLKSGDPIKLRGKEDHPLTGWRIRYAS